MAKKRAEEKEEEIEIEVVHAKLAKEKKKESAD